MLPRAVGRATITLEIMTTCVFVIGQQNSQLTSTNEPNILYDNALTLVASEKTGADASKGIAKIVNSLLKEKLSDDLIRSKFEL